MRTLKNFIRADLLERIDLRSTTWDESIRRIVSAFNRTVHPATGHTPFSIARGRSTTEVRFPWMNAPNNAKQLQTQWPMIVDKKEESLRVGRERSAGDRTLREFKVGDSVWRKVQQPGSLKPRFHGPYRVVTKIGNVNYVIGGAHGLPRSTVHVDQLIPVVGTIRSVTIYPNRRGRPRGRSGE